LEYCAEIAALLGAFARASGALTCRVLVASVASTTPIGAKCRETVEAIGISQMRVLVTGGARALSARRVCWLSTSRGTRRLMMTPSLSVPPLIPAMPRIDDIRAVVAAMLPVVAGSAYANPHSADPMDWLIQTRLRRLGRSTDCCRPVLRLSHSFARTSARLA